MEIVSDYDHEEIDPSKITKIVGKAQYDVFVRVKGKGDVHLATFYYEKPRNKFIRDLVTKIQYFHEVEVEVE